MGWHLHSSVLCPGTQAKGSDCHCSLVGFLVVQEVEHSCSLDPSGIVKNIITISPGAHGGEGRWTEAHQENIRVLQEDRGGL